MGTARTSLWSGDARYRSRLATETQRDGAGIANPRRGLKAVCRKGSRAADHDLTMTKLRYTDGAPAPRGSEQRARDDLLHARRSSGAALTASGFSSPRSRVICG
jgi:hypothetical protein